MKKKVKKSKSKLPLLEVIQDIKAYRLWIRTIRSESERADSKYNQFNLSHNYFYILYLPVTLPEEDSALPDKIKRLRLLEILAPIHQYLDFELGFSDYIVPEFNQFYEDGEPTLTYGIVYRFAFKKLSLRWIFWRALIIGGIIYAFTKFPIFSLLKGLV